MQPQHQQNIDQSVFSSEAAAIASLNHARAMLQCPVELRVKNFNFFLIIVGAIVVALRQWDDSGIRALLSFVGALLGVIFLLLDARTLH
jgi:hypothetical protein